MPEMHLKCLFSLSLCKFLTIIFLDNPVFEVVPGSHHALYVIITVPNLLR